MYRTTYCILSLLFLFTGCSKSDPTTHRFLEPTALQSVMKLKEQNNTVSSSENKGIESLAPDILRIRNKGELVVSFPESDYIPLFFKEKSSGELVGFTVELAYSLANNLGVKLRIERHGNTSSDTVQSMLTGNSDIAFLTPCALESWNLQTISTIPYLQVPDGLLVNRVKLTSHLRGNPESQTFFKTTTAAAGIVSSSPEADRAVTFLIHARIVRFASLSAALNAVLRGDILCLYLNETEIRSVLQQDSGTSVFLKPVILDDTTISAKIAIPNESFLLRDYLDIFIEEYLSKQNRDRNIKSLMLHYDEGREGNS